MMQGVERKNIRVAVLGRGGAGKSTFAARLASRLDVPLVELDSLFWSADENGPAPTPPEQWTQVQKRVITGENWVIDGDLGPYDSVLRERLAAATEIVVLDFALWRCAGRALRRSRENRDFWRWVIGYRRRSLPIIEEAIRGSRTSAPVYWAHDDRQLTVVEQELGGKRGA